MAPLGPPPPAATLPRSAGGDVDGPHRRGAGVHGRQRVEEQGEADGAVGGGAGMYVFVNTHHEADGNGGWVTFLATASATAVASEVSAQHDAVRVGQRRGL